MTPWGAVPQADAGAALRLTWPIVDPPNGRFPELTPKGKALTRPDARQTVDDPEILATGKWSAAFPLKLDNDYKMRVDEQRRLIVCRYHACSRNRVR